MIKEQIQEQEDPQAAAGEEKQMQPQEVKKKLTAMASDISGIVQNEIDVVDFALSIISAAKDKNLNSGVLRQKLELVKKEMEKIKS